MSVCKSIYVVPRRGCGILNAYHVQLNTLNSVYCLFLATTTLCFLKKRRPSLEAVLSPPMPSYGHGASDFRHSGTESSSLERLTPLSPASSLCLIWQESVAGLDTTGHLVRRVQGTNFLIMLIGQIYELSGVCYGDGLGPSLNRNPLLVPPVIIVSFQVCKLGADQTGREKGWHWAQV
ncbi:hypothetical protein CPB84DRAFT_1783267 [Gymnopilus junonius]|uniref:Uncharacterized protein n=1 Tax=Gymnopilus junonius TaxID=109634 RepID=A0A9P5NKQ1_GYMJU|nr:hypothetical protein CPB84DRAFT_1783267 [Gymnopilus junonius]